MRWYCRALLTAGDTEIDHVIPVSRGGRSYLGNLVAACSQCNQAKSDMTMDEFYAAMWQRAREKATRVVEQLSVMDRESAEVVLMGLLGSKYRPEYLAVIGQASTSGVLAT